MAVSGSIDNQVLGADLHPSLGKHKEDDTMSNEKGTIYLAYGSNLNLRQMAYRCPTVKVPNLNYKT